MFSHNLIFLLLGPAPLAAQTPKYWARLNRATAKLNRAKAKLNRAKAKLNRAKMCLGLSFWAGARRREKRSSTGSGGRPKCV